MRYVLSNLGQGLRRNTSMHLAVVLTLFVAGMILASDALLPVPTEDVGEEAPIERSWLARRLATGRAWAIVYAAAVVLVVVIYLLS